MPPRTYESYLRSPHWQDVRRRYKASDHPQDCICGETEGLHLHHLTYERLGGERLEDLTPLCPNCHTMVHVLERRGEVGIDLTGFVDEQRRQRYAKEAAEKVRPEEAWAEVNRDRLATVRMRSLCERMRQAELALWRTGKSAKPYTKVIDNVIRQMREEARAA